MIFSDDSGSDYIPPFYFDRFHVSDFSSENMSLNYSDRSHVSDSEDVEVNESVFNKNIEQNHQTIILLLMKLIFIFYLYILT